MATPAFVCASLLSRLRRFFNFQDFIYAALNAAAEINKNADRFSQPRSLKNKASKPQNVFVKTETVAVSLIFIKPFAIDKPCTQW
jgi:hypothetical protein